MSLVVNNIVKMEWEQKRWLQSKAGKGKNPVFIFACKDYEAEDGTIVPVFFNDSFAWIHADEEGTFSFDELKESVKNDYDESFPEAYSEFQPLFDVENGEFDEELLEEYGIGAYADDIKARVFDLKPYGEVTDVQGV